MKRIVVLASGRGSNFTAIADAILSGHLKAEIVAVVSNKDRAPVLDRAKERNIHAYVVSDTGKKRSQFEKELLEVVLKTKPDFLVLAGFMKVLSPEFIDRFESGRGYSRIVNIHPSLLPEFPGLHGYTQAFEQKCKKTGVTVHLVNAELDAGPICAQESFSIEDCKTVEEVEDRGLRVEHRLFPETLQWILKEDFEVKGSACVRKS